MSDLRADYIALIWRLVPDSMPELAEELELALPYNFHTQITLPYVKFGTTDSYQDIVLEAIYKALEKFDREELSMRNLRTAMNGKGPTIKRGTRRGALARFLTDAALTAIHEVAE